MNDKQESVLSLVAALLVLFSAMIAPPFSAVLAVFLLILFSIYKYWHGRHAAE
jgi:hypothetical protein